MDDEDFDFGDIGMHAKKVHGKKEKGTKSFGKQVATSQPPKMVKFHGIVSKPAQALVQQVEAPHVAAIISHADTTPLKPAVEATMQEAMPTSAPQQSWFGRAMSWLHGSSSAATKGSSFVQLRKSVSKASM